MFQKFRVIKSVDNEGRKVITYIKNNLDTDDKGRSKSSRKTSEKLPEAVQMTVKLP